jgi:NAD+ diphosphatase
MPGSSLYKWYQPAVTPEPGNNQPGYWLAFQSNRLLVRDQEEKPGIPLLHSLAKLNLIPVRTQYLGLLYGHPCSSAEIPLTAATPSGMSFQELRNLYGTLDEDIFLLAGRAIQIVTWDQTHQYCGRCGQRMEDIPGERAKKCPACSLINYPRLAPAVITAVLKGDKILLSHNAGFGGKRHSLVAGFVELGETLEECVHREILEEVGVRIKNLRYYGSQPWPFPNSLMIGFTAEWASGEIPVDGKEISDAGWYSAADLPDIPPKMSIAREIIDWFLENRI